VHTSTQLTLLRSSSCNCPAQIDSLWHDQIVLCSYAVVCVEW